MSTIPCKNQEVRVSLGGRTYAIVLQGQLNYILQKERQRIAADPLYGKTEDDVFIARLRYEYLVSVREKINEVSGIL